jgi:hypothetical protein
MLGLACCAVDGGANAAPRRSALRPARFFVDGQRNPTLLAMIRAATERRIGFAGHFSQAYVSCGPSCDSYFFVDRRTGGVTEAPQPRAEAEMIWDVAASPDSDVLKLVYGPRDTTIRRCSVQHFRWNGKRFLPIDRRAPVACPK